MRSSLYWSRSPATPIFASRSTPITALSCQMARSMAIIEL